MSARRRDFSIALMVLIAGAFVVWTQWPPSSIPVAELVEKARRLVDRGDLRAAADLVERIQTIAPDHPEGLLLAAVLAAENGDFEKALSYCQRVSSESGRTFFDARLLAGNLCLEQLGRLDQAELIFREVLMHQPDHFVANDRMVHMMGLQTRSRELIPFHLQMLRKSPKVASRIQLLMQGELAFPDVDEIDRLSATDPNCAGLHLARSRIAFLRKDLPAAVHACREALFRNPELQEAQARLGILLLESGSIRELNSWFVELPAGCRAHSGVLYGSGRLAMFDGRFEQAARCFWESLRADPNSAATSYHLGQCLLRLNRESDAEPFLKRSAQLEEYARALSSISVGTDSVSSGVDPHTAEQFLESARDCAAMAENLGLPWDAYSWVAIAAQAPRPPEWCREKLRSLQKDLHDLPLQRTPDLLNPAFQIDLSTYPQPETQEIGRSAEVGEPSRARKTLSEDQDIEVPVFEVLSENIGLSFTYHNGFPHPRDRQYRAYDFTGGGVGVIDFDCDGWPDVCFAQGCALNMDDPDDLSEKDRSDDQSQLFRNLRGRRFSDVTGTGMSVSRGYHQGISVGDFDNDGFPDLLIAGLGPNTLLHNNGDGTFTRDTSIAAIDTGHWTTSCLICDLNADGNPDLYFVNYLSGDILSRICADENQQYGHCAPQNFEAAQDQLLLSRGDGTWMDGTQSMGIEVPNGKGLGIIAADFDEDRKPDLFVANDGVPNFLFRSEGAGDAAGVRFRESAFASGVAVNAEGRSEACMGIVADYLNRDSRMSLFVTNFFEESNTLYHSIGVGAVFDDVTATSGLGMPSLQSLGFGAQVIDPRLDGSLDIVIVNGHVDSYTGRTVPYRMLPQYFVQTDGLKYREVEHHRTGAYFGREALGRSMARIDWNRDGTDELIVSHLDEPAVLLSPTMNRRGNYLAVQLRSGLSQRDAVGAVVSVSSDHGNRTVTRQLTAGDGYLASNERRLLFGLGAAAGPINITVTWPSGQVQHCDSDQVNCQVLVTEGRDGLLLLTQ